jgi:hypothetical protein
MKIRFTVYRDITEKTTVTVDVPYLKNAGELPETFCKQAERLAENKKFGWSKVYQSNPCTIMGWESAE